MPTRSFAIGLILTAVLTTATLAQNIRYVDDDAPAGGNGQTWATSYNDLQDALAEARSNSAITEILIAAGIYKPGANREDSFAMVNGVAIKGGYKGLPASGNPDERNVMLFRTILSGDIGVEGNRLDNCYHVFYQSYLNETAVLDGVVITKGHADGEGFFDENGGGMYNLNCRSVISNCSFEDNFAQKGGGIYSRLSSPDITNCRFNANSSSSGGGIYNYCSDAVISNCVFLSNSASRGAGMESCYSDVSVLNTVFAGNTGYNGCGVYQGYGTIEITNCTFNSNSARGSGAGVYSYKSAPVLTNCIVWGNTANVDPQIRGDDTIVTYSCIEGGWPGVGNIQVDPLFALAEDPHLVAGSPCIDTGTNDPPAGLPSTDLDGNPRTLDGNGDSVVFADMGAYEFDSNAQTLAINATRFDFLVRFGGSNPPSEDFGLRNSGFGTLNWKITGYPNWLSVAPSSGSSAGELDIVSVQSDITGLNSGFHMGVIIISNSTDGEQLATIPVTLQLGGSINVPADYPSIRFAIDSAADGDEVKVAPGTYVENISLLGKPISLRSTDGPNNTIIDGNKSDSVIICSSDVTAESVIEGFTITNGHNTFAGGGIYVTGSPTIKDCIIVGNKADSCGGGIYNSGGNPTIVNCVIAYNMGYGGAGGMHSCDDSSSVIRNCTFLENKSAFGYGAIGVSNSSNQTLTNCIIWGNTNEPSEQIYVSGDSTITATYCCVQEGWPGGGNISLNPHFAISGDYYISRDSPCLDSGNNENLSVYDLNGNDRLMDGDGNGSLHVDMGACEYNRSAPAISLQQTEYKFVVRQGAGNPESQTLTLANGGGLLLNWKITGQPDWLTISSTMGVVNGDNDTITLGVNAEGLPRGAYTAKLNVIDPNAINSPRVVDVYLYVGHSHHVPDDFSTIQAAIDAAFDGEEIYVGPGTYVENIVLRDKSLVLRSTNGRDSTIIDGSNDGSVITCMNNEEADIRIEGFTVTNGASNYYSGGGLRNDHCSSPKVVNCTFIHNSAHDGGGMNNRSNSNPEVINCIFSGNRATDEGGAIYNGASYPTLANCTIVGNSSASEGGGIYDYACGDGVLTLTNCTITGNTANSQGGGLYNYGLDNVDMANCIVWGNSAPEDPEIFGTGTWVWNNCVPDGWPDWGNINEDPLFRLNPDDGGDGWGDDPDTTDFDESLNDDFGDLRLQAGSPCIDAGKNDAVPADVFDLDGDGDTSEPVPFDLQGLLRFFDDPATLDTGVGVGPIVDMGAYEYHSTFVAGDCDSDGDLDRADLRKLAECTGGVNNDVAESCSCCDMDGDGDVDLIDYSLFQQNMTIPETGNGDCDDDGDVDSMDLQIFVGCQSVPGTPADEACLCSDLDGDGDVDLEDYYLFQRQHDALQ